MNTIDKAKALLNGRLKKKLAANTLAQTDGNAVSVTFWQTEILRVFANGDVLIANGGHKTATTKGRINWLLAKLGIRWGVFQKRSVWYWSKYLGNGKHSKPREFQYRNTITKTGKLL